MTPNNLTKREWFAGMALMGILSGDLLKGLVIGSKDNEKFDKDIALMAAHFADILIDILKKDIPQ